MKGLLIDEHGVKTQKRIALGLDANPESVQTAIALALEMDAAAETGRSEVVMAKKREVVKPKYEMASAVIAAYEREFFCK